MIFRRVLLAKPLLVKLFNIHQWLAWPPNVQHADLVTEDREQGPVCPSALRPVDELTNVPAHQASGPSDVPIVQRFVGG